MNLNIPNRQKLLVILAGSVVALYVLDSVLFTPLWNTWKAHSQEIVALRTKVTEGRNTIARGPRTNRLLAEMETNAMPKDQTQAESDVYTAVNRWGSANNIELSSIRPQWKRGTDRYSLVEWRIDATGSLQSLGRFMYELERSPLALRVDSVEFVSRDESGSKLALALVVSGLRLSPLVVERK